MPSPVTSSSTSISAQNDAVRFAAIPGVQLPQLHHRAHSPQQGGGLIRGDSSGVRSYFIEMLQQGFQPNAASLMTGFACCRRLEGASRVLEKMVDSGTAPSVVTYTPLVRGFLRAGILCGLVRNGQSLLVQLLQ
ncbi:unnamed protein product [Urochloa humidicola]